MLKYSPQDTERGMHVLSEKSSKDDVVSWLRTPQNVQVLITGTCKYYFTWQKRSGRCSWIQDLKTRGLSQITWGGPKYHHECRYERKAEGNLTWMSRQCDHCSPVLGCYTAGFIEEGGRGQQSTHAMNATLEAGKGVKTDSSAEASEERMAWLMPIETDFRLLTLRPIRELIYVGLNHWVCGNLLQHLEKTLSEYTKIQGLVYRFQSQNAILSCHVLSGDALTWTEIWDEA